MSSSATPQARQSVRYKKRQPPKVKLINHQILPQAQATNKNCQTAHYGNTIPKDLVSHAVPTPI